MTSQSNSQGGVEELLRRLNAWFLEAAPQHYRGCGLHIDVEAALAQPRPNREAVARELAKCFGARSWNEMAEGRADLRRRIVKDGYDINEATLDDCYEAADAILALLASPAVRRDGGSRKLGEDYWP